MKSNAAAQGFPGASRRQKGATLIAVLMVLVVLMLLGVTAMRMGLSSLSVATNSQVGNLLYQSADVGLYHMERVDPMTAVQPGGAYASISTPGREDAFCLQMKGANPALKAGTCDTASDADFVSGRNAVVTQLYVKSKGQVYLARRGDDLNNIPSDVFTVTSTSVMPTFGSATTGTINGCLAKPGDDTTRTMSANGRLVESSDAAVESSTECLIANGAVFVTLVDDYRLVREPK